MKKSKNIILVATPVLSTVLFNACGGTRTPSYTPPPPTTTSSTPFPVSSPAQLADTRDVYQNQADCVKDWGDASLCQQMNDTDDDDYKKKHKLKTGGKHFYGPGYKPGSRTIIYQGKNITPSGTTSKLPAFTSTLPSSTTTTRSTTGTTTSKTTTGSSTTTPKSTTSSSSSTYTSPSSTYSNPSSTTRGGFGSTSSSSSSSSSRSSSSSSSGGS